MIYILEKYLKMSFVLHDCGCTVYSGLTNALTLVVAVFQLFARVGGDSRDVLSACWWPMWRSAHTCFQGDIFKSRLSSVPPHKTPAP